MKKALLVFIVLTSLASCGPKRLGCGPRSCLIDIEKQKIETKKILQLQDFLFITVVA